MKHLFKRFLTLLKLKSSLTHYLCIYLFEKNKLNISNRNKILDFLTLALNYELFSKLTPKSFETTEHFLRDVCHRSRISWMWFHPDLPWSYLDFLSKARKSCIPDTHFSNRSITNVPFSSKKSDTDRLTSVSLHRLLPPPTANFRE